MDKKFRKSFQSLLESQEAIDAMQYHTNIIISYTYVL